MPISVRVVRNSYDDKTEHWVLICAQPHLPAKAIYDLLRWRWEIENRLHWVRDVTFDEDRCQVRTGAAPQVMAALRNLIIGLFRLRI